jgi:membrane protease YdiL (CAAX protease family)
MVWAATVVPVSETSAKVRVRWGRIGLFYGIALGWAVVIAGLLYLLGQRTLSGTDAAPWVGIVLAVAYMPVPLVAALIVERLDGRGYLLRRMFNRNLGKAVVRLVVVAVVVVAVLLLGMLAASWLAGNVLGVAGAGRVLFAPEDLVANTIAFTGESMDATQVAALAAQTPGLWLLLLITFGSALLAGFTVNGVFAFGEEYGWRGWLAEELRPLGAFWANVVTGVLWGLWHAPLILLGYNYGSYRLPGVAFMVAWCVAASFLLWRAREVTGTLLAPAVLHGAINGFAGVFLIVLVDTNTLMAAPMGLIGIAVVALAAALLWLFTRSRRPADPAAVEAVETVAERAAA